MSNFNNNLQAELVRNASGYFLVLIGLLAIGVGAYLPVNASAIMTDAGKALVTSALLAFQIKRTPDGNTTTTQITTPEPTIPPVPVIPEKEKKGSDQ